MLAVVVALALAGAALAGPAVATDTVEAGGYRLHRVMFGAGVSVAVKLEGKDCSGLALVIMDDVGREVLSEKGMGRTKTVNFVPANIGMYYVVVKNHSGGAVTYRLSHD